MLLHLTGNFRAAYVDLDTNALTRFDDESVFRPILEQMVAGAGKLSFDYVSKKLKD